jgi:branched-chain amino acid transport system ATP-binding protein
MTPLLEVHGLTVDFGGLKALRGVDLGVAEGAIHGLVGPNGAGKSTLVNALTGVVRPTQGQISLDGVAIAGLSTHRIAAAGIARTFQNIRHFAGMTVLENVLVGAHRHFRAGLGAIIGRSAAARAEEAREVARARELLDFVGLSGVEDDAASGLAYGHQRRLEIARALMLAPRLLLLDEPMAGMNTAEKDDLSGVIRATRARGITVLVIEHDMQVIRALCDRLTVLHHGELLAEGRPADVLADRAVQAAYLGRAA